MFHSEDQELVKKFQSGDQSAFNELVRRYQKEIYQIARHLLNSHEEAEDLSQEAFIKAYQGLKNFRSESNFFTWIYRITVNLSLNVLRRRKIRYFLSLETPGLTISSPANDADQQMENQEMIFALQNAIERLPNKQKLVFTLRYHQHLPHAEIARILGRDEGTIRANYHLAIRKLQEAVKI